MILEVHSIIIWFSKQLLKKYKVKTLKNRTLYKAIESSAKAPFIGQFIELAKLKPQLHFKPEFIKPNQKGNDLLNSTAVVKTFR
jgi:hypothetical protein